MEQYNTFCCCEVVGWSNTIHCSVLRYWNEAIEYIVLLWVSGMQQYNTVCCFDVVWWSNTRVSAVYIYPLTAISTVYPGYCKQIVLVWRHNLFLTKYPVCVPVLYNLCNAPVHSKLDTKILCNQLEIYPPLCNVQQWSNSNFSQHWAVCSGRILGLPHCGKKLTIHIRPYVGIDWCLAGKRRWKVGMPIHRAFLVSRDSWGDGLVFTFPLGVHL